MLATGFCNLRVQGSRWTTERVFPIGPGVPGSATGTKTSEVDLGGDRGVPAREIMNYQLKATNYSTHRV